MPASWTVFDSLKLASQALASHLLDSLRAGLKREARLSLVLAGGSTPRTLYRMVAEGGGSLPWDRVHFFWGDERCVPLEDPLSNYQMAREELLDPLDVPVENVHPMPVQLPQERAVDSYERTLRLYFPGLDSPRFDFLLLGLGSDGHIASLFPGGAGITERRRWVVPGQAPEPPRPRLSLTLPAINAAREVHFLVSGPGKAAAVQRTLQGVSPPEQWPAAGVRPQQGVVRWWLDREAARSLETP